MQKYEISAIPQWIWQKIWETLAVFLQSRLSNCYLNQNLLRPDDATLIVAVARCAGAAQHFVAIGSQHRSKI